jgi:dihydroflavonol-4-reductase
VIHPSADEYVFTEEDWAYALPSWLLPPGMASAAWDDAGLEANGYVSYGMAKVATERLVFATAAEDGRFDTVSVQPSRVLGPLLSPIHHIPESWQETVGKLLQGQPATDGWWSRWNIVDVRDVAEAQARIAESDVSHNGDRYLLTASDSAGELSVPELQEHLQRLFPGYNVAGAPKEYASFLQARGGALPNHHAFRNKAERDLGLAPRPVDETLRDTARSLIDLGVITPALLAR